MENELNTRTEIPEKGLLSNFETPERTPFQRFVVLDDHIQLLKEKLSIEKSMLKETKGILSKFRMMKRIRETKEEINHANRQKHDLSQYSCLKGVN